MAKSHNNTGRARNGPPFAQIFHWLRKTPAWLSMHPYSRLLYIELRGRYTGSNNGDIVMSYREAADLLACSNGPVITGFRELQDRGFIVAVRKGAFSWKVRFGEGGRATTWRLTELPADYPEKSHGGSYEFKNWKPEPREKKTRGENLTPKASKSHAINDGMASKSHANGVKYSRHLDQSGGADGVRKSRTLISTISPMPLGQAASQALLNSRLVRAARKSGGGDA